MSGSVNAAQALRWNGESGRHWIAHRDRYQAGHQRLIKRELLFPEGPIPEMLRKTGLEQIDRLDDVGVTRNDKFC